MIQEQNNKVLHGVGVSPKNLITKFTGEHEFLSNFYKRPFIYFNDCFISSEHAYQASKAVNLEDRERIKNASTPREARKIGRQINKIVDNWDDIKVEIMYDILRSKFSEIDLANSLIATGNKYLIEGNTWNDTFWGCEPVENQWIGKNMLGILLMDLRDELQE